MDTNVDELRMRLKAQDEVEAVQAIVTVGKQHVQELAGDVEVFLRHPAGAVRGAAAKTLGFFLRASEYESSIRALAENEAETDARMDAIVGWSSLWSESKDATVIQVLVGWYLDQGLAWGIRVNSLLGVLRVMGVPAREWPSVRTLRDLDSDSVRSMVGDHLARAGVPGVSSARIAAMSQIPQQIRWQLENGSVWLNRDDVHPHDGLARAIKESGADRSIYAATVLALLTSDDVRHRTGAVAVLGEVVRELGAGRVAGILRDNVALFRGVRPAWNIGEEDLEQGAIRAVVPAIRADGSGGIEWLRGLVPVINAQPERYLVWISTVASALAAHDTDWFFENALELSPKTNLWVIHALPPARRAAYIAARAPWPPERKDVVGQHFWKKFPPEEAARLRALMWPEAS